MARPADIVTLTLPREAVNALLQFVRSSSSRLHDLLERHTDASLTRREQNELRWLVEVTQFGQLIEMQTERNRGQFK